MKLKVKKGSTVEVISGAEKGKRGTVLDVDAKRLRVRIQGVKIQTHFDKKDGIKKVEGFIDYSNVKLTQAPTRKKTATKTNPA